MASDQRRMWKLELKRVIDEDTKSTKPGYLKGCPLIFRRINGKWAMGANDRRIKDAGRNRNHSGKQTGGRKKRP